MTILERVRSLKLIAFLRRRPNFSSMLLAAPAFIVLVFFSVSLFFLFLLSFYRFVPAKLWEPTFTLENYVSFLTDPFYLNYVWVTIKMSGECTIVALIMGYPVAYFLARAKSSIIKGIILTLITVSNFINVVIRMYAWLITLQDGGVVNDLLIYFGIISEPIRLTYNEFGVLVGLVHWVLPFTIFSLVGSIQNIDPSLEEAAQSLGAKKFQTFLKVTLPLSLPGIIAATLLTFMGEIAAFVIPMMMGGGHINFISNLIYTKIIYVANFPFGSTTSMVLLSVTLMIGYGINKLLAKKVKVQ